MSGYEEEHNIPHAPAPSASPRRPDMSSFFAALSASETTTTRNPHATPTPADLTALYRDLANSYRVMLGEREGVAPLEIDTDPITHPHENELLGRLVATLMQSAENPPSTIDGMPPAFFDTLERIPKSSLKEGDSCPICGIDFLDDKYPLVVELPCRKGHWFDLECVRPWLSVKRTCPLDRVDLKKREEERREKLVPKVVQEEEEWDEMFA